MKQIYDQYTAEDHEIWQILFSRQLDNLRDKCTPHYFECLEEFGEAMPSSKVPNLDEVSEFLKTKTGWSVEVVKGLIPVDQFFDLLAERRFPSSTWLRSKDQLDYLEEPDMFHDTFGHVPLIADPVYAGFMESYGKLGQKYRDDLRVVTALQRVYWFTIEFGLMKGRGKSQIYGAGIISSFGETNHVFEDNIEVIDFDIEKIIFNHFVNSEIQMRYFLLNDFDQLYNSIGELQSMIHAGNLPPAEIVA
jgi:phenylalanine-4-hydroxylase